MSLESSISKAVFQGNGAAVTFPFSFRVWDAAELLVQVTGADGIARDVTAQCSIVLSDDGGTVTYAPGGVPLSAGHTLVILRNMPFLQDVKLITGTRFDPAVIEEALDRATAERQQLLEKVSRAVVVPADSADPPEELADQIFEARDRAETAAKKAASSEDEARNQADRAEKEADRAANAAILGTQAENLEAVWRMDTDIPAGGTLALPVSYFAGRNMLHLSYDGVELYRGPQYEETGERDELSSSVKMLIPLSRGTVMHAWAVASNVARNVEAAEEQAKAEADRARREADRAESEADRARAIVQAAVVDAVGQAQAQADRAEAEADRAADTVRDATGEAVGQATEQADRAEKEADRAETARNVAQNAAQEATEQADRADDAAMDAGRYRNEAQEAAKCAAASIRSRSIAAVQSADLLDRVPSGFFVINTDIVLPGTIQQPLTPVDSVNDIPNMDGFFLLVPPFENDCQPQPDKPEKPERPDVPEWLLPCGRRGKL